MRRYAKSKRIDVADSEKMIINSISKIVNCVTLTEIMGYEGMGAKYYFSGLSQCVEKDFEFHGRSKRPPKDEFNSMLSLGYSIW